jgi:cytochrome b pre-mRNA-processing protein 3
MFFNKKNKEIVELCVTLYKLIVKQARTKEFYLNLKVPDTIDGRFELIILHFFLLERTLDKEIKKDQLIYKELLEIMYKDFDMSLREIGVGDLSVGKKIYQMTEAFSGRLFAYRKFNNKKNFSSMEKTIKKNIYGTLNNIDTKYVEIIKSYIIDSMEYIDKSLIYEVSENSSIFIDLNRYIINK